MARGTNRGWVLGVAIVFVAACGGGGESVDAGLDAPTPTADAWALDARASDLDAPDGVASTDAARPSADEVRELVCATVARVRCSAPYACGCAGFGEPGDPAACESSEADDCRGRFSDHPWGRGLAEETVGADRDALVACLAELEASYDRCSGAASDLEARCAGAFVELDVELDEPCASLGASGGRCADGTGVCLATGLCGATPRRGQACDGLCDRGLVCVEGTCASPGAMGAGCARDADCADGLACAGSMCRALAASGASCSGNEACALGLRCRAGACVEDRGASCADDATCAGLERCGPGTFVGVCRAREALGAACDSPEACDGGRCDSSLGTCVAPAEVGDACGDPSDCRAGLVCAFTGTCSQPGTDGEPCVAGFGATGCGEGLGCFEEVCRPLGVAGEPCDAFGECAGSFVCRVEPDGVRCGMPRAIGELCANDGECGPNGRCDSFGSGRCAPRGDLGDACIFDGQCRVGLLCALDAATSSFRCAAPAPIGEACGRSELCVGAAYCRSEPVGAECAPRVCDELGLLFLEE